MCFAVTEGGDPGAEGWPRGGEGCFAIEDLALAVRGGWGEVCTKERLRAQLPAALLKSIDSLIPTYVQPPAGGF